jgi:hypothetical protein
VQANPVYVPVPWLVAGSLCLTLLGWLLGWWGGGVWRRRLELWRTRRTEARAPELVLAAERLLKSRGYRVQERFVAKPYRMQLNGKQHDVSVKISLVVAHAGNVAVAVVKTGAAASMAVDETRRHLLECQLATGCKRVLLVDPVAGSIIEVLFPVTTALATAAVSGTVKFARVCFALGVVVLTVAALMFARR